MQLEEYYNKLQGFMEHHDFSSKAYQKKETMEAPRRIPDEIIPFLSFVLSSKKAVYDRIDSLYNDRLSKIEADRLLDKRFKEIDVPELEKCLTPYARIEYKKMLLICLESDTQLPGQLLKLLKRAYPLSYISEAETDFITEMLFGGYDIRNAAITYLILYLRGVSYDDRFSADIVNDIWKQFETAYTTYVPLPFWNGIKADYQGNNDVLSLSSVIDERYRPDEEKKCEDMHNSVMELREKKNSEVMQKTCILCQDKMSMEEILGLNIGDTIFLKKKMDAAEKHPNAQYRLKFKKSEGTPLLKFIYRIISNLYISREELLDYQIPADEMRWIYQAYEDEIKKDASCMPPEYTVFAGLLYAMSNRIRNAEESAERFLGLAEEANRKRKNEIPDKSSEEIEHLKKELERADAKNRKLETQLSQLQVEKGKELSKKNTECSGLRKERDELKSNLEQLISCQDEEEELETDDERLEEMKEVIRNAKLLFVGGHPSWQNAMKAEFPNFRFLEARDYTTATPSVFKNISYIIYNVKWNNHGMYYKCLKMKGNDSRFLFVETNNVNRTICKIYKTIQSGDVADAV